MYKDYIKNFLGETGKITQLLAEEQAEVINDMVNIVREVRDNKGRVFIAGIGGGSGTGAHATCDFNKIGGVSTFNLSDNATLFTALANDEGWDSVFHRQMEMHHFNDSDCLLIFSVGGGNAELSSNLMKAVDFVKERNGKVIGVVGRDDGHTAIHGDAVVVIPNMHDDRRTPHTENYQMVFNHLIVNALSNEGNWAE